MTNKIVLTANIVDNCGNIIASNEISKKEIVEPTNISEFGYSLEEQINILTAIQQKLIDPQANFLKCTT